MNLKNSVLVSAVKVLFKRGQVYFPNKDPSDQRQFILRLSQAAPQGLQPLHVSSDTQGGVVVRTDHTQCLLNIAAMNAAQSMSDHMGL
jgi:hypothetical protein